MSKNSVFSVGGYLFYGSVTQLDKALSTLNFDEIEEGVLDASRVTGFDTSAKICLERVWARHHEKIFKWIVVTDKSFLKIFELAFPPASNNQVLTELFSKFNLAIDSIKQSIAHDVSIS